MQIIHRYVMHVGPTERERFEHIGYPVKFSAPQSEVAKRLHVDTVTVFKVAESHPHWPAVDKLARELGARESASTEFAKDELRSATALNMKGDWHHGYPMPDMDGGYVEQSYDTTHYCSKCGVGGVQKAPFRMRGEPKWGRRNILELNWVFDEFFVQVGAVEAAFEKLGIATREVLMNKRDKSLRMVVQLINNVYVDVDMGDAAYEVCRSCGTKKYLPHTKGFFPLPKSIPGPLFRSRQWFGSGGAAWNAVFISNDTYKQTIAAGLAGVKFYACA